ncbi:hypothetical protein GCM10009539_59360 [Cryptosporangium japonicum]|uniref:Uncharacterized protein n=1 Tax=Cryptosporangium japonicum TaxID=80872 RepID=A0ABN0UXV8_9ACTN
MGSESTPSAPPGGFSPLTCRALAALSVEHVPARRGAYEATQEIGGLVAAATRSPAKEPRKLLRG